MTGAPIPADPRAVDTAHPDRVIGTGTAGSCTSAAVVAAVAAGGVIAFDCGAAPVTIPMAATAKIVNAHPRTVLDGGGKVTLSGGGRAGSCTRTPATRSRATRPRTARTRTAPSWSCRT